MRTATDTTVGSIPARFEGPGRDRVTLWNHVAERLFRIDSDAAIGQELFSLETPLDRGVFKRRFLKAKQQEKQKAVLVSDLCVKCRPP